MKLVLSPDITLDQLSHQLTEKFHQLKLVFFTKGHERFKGTNAKFIITDRSTLLKDCSNVVKEEELLLIPTMKTYELEEALENRYGLFVQVFRLTTRQWIETSTTDARTLEEQNHQAEVEVFYGSTLQDEHIDYRDQD
ncbi:MAG: hypothetical protein ACOYOA_07245 [Saprospiraceae bacterium]|jgi:hypothetical protein